MGIRFGLGGRFRRCAAKRTEHVSDPARTAAQLVDSVLTGHATDLELVVQAARLVVSTRFASVALLVQRLGVSVAQANRILDRLEHCGVVGPAEGTKTRCVLTTSAQLPAVIEEFIDRG